MKATISNELLQLLLTATPEQQAAMVRYLRGEVAGLINAGFTEDEKRRFAFERAGRYWRVVFEGMEGFPLEDTLGARYLDYLLHHPNEPVAAFDLEVAVQPEKGAARGKESIQATLDGDSVRAYLRELTRLRGERAEATKAGDVGEVERLDEDIEALEEALENREQMGDTGGRARDNVRKAIGSVRRQLAKGGEAERAFGKHIERLVSTGFECLYSQPAGRIWG